MIKRTLCFSNPAYLSTRKNQLYIDFPDKECEPVSISIEDIGVVILEHPQITITSGLLIKLTEAKCLVIQCDKSFMPVSVLQTLTGHTLLSERMQMQIRMSEPLKKQLWQQTVQSKILNQALHLEAKGKDARKLHRWIKEIKSGDGENHEAYAAAYYFQNIFDLPNFSRNEKDTFPNHWLNYGYAILRAMVARGILSSGLHPTIGIFHHNQYNPYCLADDLMEPYRPFVDKMVYEMISKFGYALEMQTAHKNFLLQLPTMDVQIEKKQSPLMVAISRTTNSFFECLEGKKRKIIYPLFY